MPTELAEKRLYVLGLKIEKLKGEKSPIQQYWYIVVAIGLCFIFYTPSHKGTTIFGGTMRSAMEHSGLGYYKLAGALAVFYSLISTISHFTSVWQNKHRIKNLESEVRELDKAIQSNK